MSLDCRAFRHVPTVSHRSKILIISFVLTTVILLGMSIVPSHDGNDLLNDARMLAMAPNAVAAVNESVVVHSYVIFNGSASTGTATMNYTWTISNGTVTILYGMVVTYEFTATGIYNITLNVTDSNGFSSEDTVVTTVTADTEPPRAVAGYNRRIDVGSRLALNGSSSTDNTGRILKYSWSYTYKGVPVELDGSYVTIWLNSTGDYLITLTVTDPSGLTNSTTVTIHVSTPPTWLERNLVGVILIVLVISLIAALLARKLYRDHAVVTPTDIEKLRLTAASGLRVARQFSRNSAGVVGLAILIVFLILAIASPFFLHKYPNPDSIGWGRYNPTYASPSKQFWFGTDYYGRDVFTLTILGTRASLIVGFMASLISIVLGTAIGLTAGYFGKLSDEILMRFTDFFLVIPWFPLMIVFATVMGRSFTNVIIVIGITSWPSTSRIVRAQVLSIREKTFVERAICVGAGSRRIISKHILPNVFPLIFANTILLVANSIFSESFLDFFGLGDPNVISWGTILEFAYEKYAFSSYAWWNIFFPGFCIVVLIMAFYLMGDALDEVLNPKLRKR
jgi:peptide/nickel transport system permease protein